MGRPKKHENRKSITIYLSEAEYKYAVLQAGDIPLSTWCLQRLFVPGEVPKVVNKGGSIDIDQAVVEAVYVQRKPKRGKTCAHGVERGHHCWQCQGLAKVE